MAEENIDTIESGSNSNFVALIRELKLSLYTIAREAELHSQDKMQAQAEQTLRLLDSYVLSAQTEYGQQRLALAPLAIGSVMHQVAYDLRASTGCDIAIEAKAHQPVMTNARALQNLLSIAGQAMYDVAKERVVFRSYATRGGDVGVGVFAKDVDITADDLRIAVQSAGRAHMPMARHSERSGIMFVIADNLAQALGGSLEVKRMGRYRGLATILPKSEQLAFI